MKRKPKLAPRNPLVAAVKFRKAGAHDKTTKARRRAHRVQTLREASVHSFSNTGARRTLESLDTSPSRAWARFCRCS
jgi:hypothetical protein